MFFDFLEVNKGSLVRDAHTNATDEIFSLGKLGSLNLLYAPLFGRVYAYDNESNKTMRRTIKDLGTNSLSKFDASSIPAKLNEKFNCLGLFLTSDCNLRCAYCYASAGQTQKILNFEFAKTAIDFISKNSDEQLMVLFHGGGEPTLEFKLMKKIREYANNLKNDVKFLLQTNGVFSNETRNWILKNIDTISLSCDGPPHVQDVQRPLKNGGRSSPIVEKNIRYFIENSKRIGVLSVMSKFSMNKQTEILDYFYGIGIKRVKFTLLIEGGRCTTCPTICSSSPDWESLLSSLPKAMELADMYGIDLTLPVSFDAPKDAYCGISGKSFLLTPDGFVSPCVYVSAGDSKYKELLFGYFDEKKKKIKIDNKKLDFLRSRVVQNIPACQKCFLKWNCAGGCAISDNLIHNKDIYSPDIKTCNWMRKLGQEILSYKVQKDLIKIKPFLEERPHGLVYRNIFNIFELKKLQNNEPEAGAILRVGMNKMDPTSLAKDIAMRHPRLLLISFKLSKENLNLKSGEKIESFLRTLKSEHINFTITKPLPRCLFNDKYKRVVEEFRIPKNCEECLELFTVKGNSFHVCKTSKNISQKKIKSRRQIYEFFKKFNTQIDTPMCKDCVYKIRRRCNGLCI